ncbi:MAG: quinone-dependent dihydroorotate dehydrogenase [Kofleriaceae bacterium]|nr:quinone-dependent dihydroorotate dehydrogenase [Kofleriaceae bacterium]
MYRFFYWLVLSRLPAEWVHSVAFGGLRAVMAVPGVKRLTQKFSRPKSEALVVHAMGLRFPSPLGLAAGFDKNAVGFEALGALGFGFIEIGTVTGQAQEGNPKPRMFRLLKDRAVINRMGFNNRGSEQAAQRLSKRSTKAGSLIIGANIGKTKVVLEEDAISDYVLSTERLGPQCDYLVVNVSSPNTPGLRNLQAISKLRPLLAAVRTTLERVCPDRRVPLLVKIAPDLSNDDVIEVADLALELGLEGIIATNTTISREALQSPSTLVEEIGAGGLSGAPLKARSLEVLKLLKSRVGDSATLISAGGIENADDALERLQAGATLLQAYTAFIYEGPNWPRKINKSLAKKL